MTGFESPTKEYEQQALSLDDSLIQHPSATFIGQAQGHSMGGHGMFCGEILIVSRAVQVQDLDIIVVNLNGVFVCKKIDKANGVSVLSLTGR